MRLAALLAAVTVLGPGPPAGAQELTLSVAVSMKEAVEEVGRRFAADHAGVTLRYNVGASGLLQKQIEAGAPVDLFVSAGQREMDALERQGLLLPGTRRVFARNLLVVVVPADSPRDVGGPADLLRPEVRRIAIGDPRTVPVGQYAEESLRSLGLWERLRPKLILAENVRQVLDYVARGEVDAGFVYRTDAALRRGRVREAFRPGQETYRPVTYPAAVVKDARHPDLARAFIGLLLSPAGQEVLRRLGFLPVGAAVP